MSPLAQLKEIVDWLGQHWKEVLIGGILIAIPTFVITSWIYREQVALYEQRLAAATQAPTPTMAPTSTPVPTVNPAAASKEKLKSELLSGGGQFEWQWAGENWQGTMIFTEGREGTIEAALYVQKITKKGEIVQLGPDVMNSLPDVKGRVTVYEDHVEIENLLVEKTTFDENSPDQAKSKSTQIIEVSVYPVTAYSGRITYYTEPGKPVGAEQGQINLVKKPFVRSPFLMFE